MLQSPFKSQRNLYNIQRCRLYLGNIPFHPSCRSEHVNLVKQHSTAICIERRRDRETRDMRGDLRSEKYGFLLLESKPHRHVVSTQKRRGPTIVRSPASDAYHTYISLAYIRMYVCGIDRELCYRLPESWRDRKDSTLDAQQKTQEQQDAAISLLRY